MKVKRNKIILMIFIILVVIFCVCFFLFKDKILSISHDDVLSSNENIVKEILKYEANNDCISYVEKK